jgi:predicted ATPase
MLKKLTIRNFKAIQDVTIEFTPLTVLIGENGCGKSTILQAIEFLHSASFRDIPEYLREKGWSSNEIKSQLSDGITKQIEFISIFEFQYENKIIKIEWFLFIDYKDNKWSISELIKIDEEGAIAYSTMPIINELLVIPNTPEPFKSIKLESSLLKIINDDIKLPRKHILPIITLQEYLSSSNNFGLLSPDKMRTGKNDVAPFDIGTGGEILFSYIDSLEKEEKIKLTKIISELIDINIDLKVYHRRNKAELVLEEKRENSFLRITDQHISDGLLRLIAFAAISLQNTKTSLSISSKVNYVNDPEAEYLVENVILKNGIVLFDEIENGINPYKTERVVSLLRSFVEKTERQVLLTTHSPVILNDFKPEEIIFLWKDKSGSVHAKQFFETEEMRDKLDYLNPGEIWENFGRDRILTKLGIKPEEF